MPPQEAPVSPTPARRNAEMLLSSPPPSPEAEPGHASQGMLSDDAIGDDGMAGATSEELPPLAETLTEPLTEPGDIEMGDTAALDPIAGLAEEPPLSPPRETGNEDNTAAAPSVFAQAAGGGAAVCGHGAAGVTLAAATSLDLLRQTVSASAVAHAPTAVDKQAGAAAGDIQPPAAAADTAQDGVAAPPRISAIRPGTAAAADAGALPGIRTKRTARALPPPITEPPPPAAVAPRGSKKTRLKVVRGSKRKDRDDGAASGSAPPSARADGASAAPDAAHFICTEGGGPCSGMVCLPLPSPPPPSPPPMPNLPS